MILWHGGRNLENSHREIIKSNKGRWEYGPGLYLTTHYETAYKYAKGGGKTYQVEVELGNNIKNIQIPIDHALEFISLHVKKNKSDLFLSELHSNMKRMNLIDKVEANVFLNLLINSDYIVHEKTKELNKFLVSNGADYSLVDRFSGRDETVIVLFNRSQIKKVVPVKAKDVKLEDYELPIQLTSKTILKP